MDKKDQKDMSNLEFNQENPLNDYKSLIQKLKSIKDTINMLEKILLEKEI